MESFRHAGVVGSGGWGTALGVLLCQNGLRVTMWGRHADTVAQLQAQRENARYLPGVRFPDSLGVTNSLEMLLGCDVLLMVTPSKGLRDTTLALGRAELPRSIPILSCVKGCERGTGLRMSQVIREVLHDNPVAALSGPSHAEEVARGMPTAVTIASTDASLALALQAAFNSRSFRAYTNADIAGVELGGALKNIYALAAGVCDGLGLGDNAKAALVTRSLTEMIRMGCAMGGKASTFQGLSGIGDLMVTCFSRHSRNRGVGERLGRGESLAEITHSMQMVAEGVPTTYSVHECARQAGIETPIVEQIRSLLDGVCTPKDALRALLSREPKPE